MKILIAFASRHGSTHEIANALALELRIAGHSVRVRPVDAATDLTQYQAAIIGSAVYLDNWLPAARNFVEANHDRLAHMPVWLFSSGPLGENDYQPNANPAHLDALMRETCARGHRLFVGRLDRNGLGILERVVARVTKVPQGDYRDWEAVRGWAHEIASTLSGLAEPVVERIR